MVHFGDFLKTWSLLSNSVTRQITFKMHKKIAQVEKLKCDILRDFQTLCLNNFFVLDFYRKVKIEKNSYHSKNIPRLLSGGKNLLSTK